MARTDRGHFIGGRWTIADGETIPVEDPTRNEIIAHVANGTAEDVDGAVAAANVALPRWSETPAAERADILLRIAEQLEVRQDAIATSIVAEVGMPAKLALKIQTLLPIATFRNTAALIREHAIEQVVGRTRVRAVPVGVVAAITPWNYPLHQTAAKVAPALAAGCTVVLKPSELAPLTALMLAEACAEADLPTGVLNIVTGSGATGQHLVAHPGIDMISFTGSTATGKAIARIAADHVKRVSLELGGKSASIVLDDADLSQAVRATVSSCFLNSGQTCSALTRLIVPREKLVEAAELAREAALTFTLGDPRDAATRMGPVISASQRQRVRSFIDAAIADGATLVTGGSAAPEGLAQGYFVRPTVFSAVDPVCRLAQEEVFGPVLAIIGASDAADAIRIANGTRYGLGGAVWSVDLQQALIVAQRLRTGQVHVNGAPYDASAPFGGFKQSGYGREFGPAGIEEFLEPQAILV